MDTNIKRSEIGEAYEYVNSHLGSLRDTKTETIKDIQEQRGAVYGKFAYQAECVGRIIYALQECCVHNGDEPTNAQVGCFAYMAVKLARFAVDPSHKDTLVDMESYANLIKELHT